MKSFYYYALAAFFLFFEMAVQSSPSVMAVTMMHDLGLTAATFGIAMGCYFISYTALQIPVGLLFDRYPVKYLLLLATAVCGLGACLFSLGEAVWVLALARLLTGFGSAFAFVGVLITTSQWFDKRHFAVLVGVAQLVAALGAMFGEMPLAYWVNHLGWQQTSLLLGGIGFGLSALIGVSFGYKKPQQSDAASAPVRPRQSLVNIVKNKQTYWIALYAFSAWAPVALFAELWGVPYLMTKLHTNNVTAAAYCSVIWIALAVTSPLLGWVSDYVLRRRVFLIVSSAVGLVGVVPLLYSGIQGIGVTYLAMIAIGVAAAGQILAFALTRDHFPRQDLGIAIATINMAVVMGGMIFQPLVGVILHHLALLNHPLQLHHYRLEEYQWALLALPLCYVLGLVMSVFCIRDNACVVDKTRK